MLSLPHLFLPPWHLYFIFLFSSPREVASFKETFTYEVSPKNKPHPSSLSSIVCNHLHPSSSHPLPLSFHLFIFLPLHPSIYTSYSQPPGPASIHQSLLFIRTTSLSDLQPHIHLPLISRSINTSIQLVGSTICVCVALKHYQQY